MNENFSHNYNEYSSGRTRHYGGARALATLIAVAIISAAAGASGAYLVIQNYEAPAIYDTQPNFPSDALPQIETQYSDSGTKGGITSVVEKAAASVVEIYTESSQLNYFGRFITEGAGSGIVYSDDGYIITNNHVIADASSIWVRTSDGERYEASVIGSDSQTDIALLKIDADGIKPVTFGDSDKIQVGEVAVAIGNPLGTLGGSVTSGIISAKGRELVLNNETMILLQTSAAVNPGNSGGGLFDGNGDLIGIINAKSTGSSDGATLEGLGFAIPSNVVKNVAGDILEKGYVGGRPQMGVSIRELTDLRTAAQFGLNRLGVYVLEVTENNNLKVGDLIIAANGEEITTNAELAAILLQFKAGDTLEVIVVRDGREMSVEVPLTEKIPEYIKERIKSA